MIHAEERTPGNRHFTQQGRLWVNFLGHCFLLPLSSQAVDISVNGCTVPDTAFQNLPLYWLVRLAAHCSVLNWVWGERERINRNAKEGSLKQATAQCSWFWSDCIITGDLSMEPAFAQAGSKIIMSVGVVGEPNISEGNLIGVVLGIIQWLVLCYFPWAIVKETCLTSVTTMGFS